MQDQQTNAQAIAKLPEVITYLLKEQGVAIPYAWALGIHPDAMHEEPQIQMFQCARQWSSILSQSKEDTRFARYCLTSASTVKIWLQSFTTLVIPMYLKILQEAAGGSAIASDRNTTCEIAEEVMTSSSHPNGLECAEEANR
jgi:hypothetical protein